MNFLIPEKKYFKIGEASRLAGLEPHVLRFWETEFSRLSPKKDSGKQRLYTKEDLQLILDIKKLLYDENYTIAGAKKKIDETELADREAGSKAPAILDDDLRKKLISIKNGLEEIRNML
ncbi:MAG: MerR family transcriptional regulator [bacterium]|nr:MerR family transcriptional regulator [bacterium]